MANKPSRKQQILQALAHELEQSPGKRITTAALARSVGVSEAALYRHFASKAKMFEALIEFAEESVFGRINQIMADEKQTTARCAKLFYLLLAFAEKNPGISRVLLGDALVGETERLRTRVDQFFGRIETQFRQILREAGMRDGQPSRLAPETGAALLLAVIEGRLQRYQRSGFKQPPSRDWEQLWDGLAAGLF